MVEENTATGTVRVLDSAVASRDLATGGQLEGLPGGNVKLLALSGPIADAISSGSNYPAFSITTPTGVQIFIINTAPAP